MQTFSSNDTGTTGRDSSPRSKNRTGQFGQRDKLRAVPSNDDSNVAGTVEPAVPNSVEAEEAVLGSLLLDRDTIARVAPVLKPNHFFSEARAALYLAMLNLYADQTPADLVTVRNELKNLGALGDGEGQVKSAYLFELMQRTPTPVHVQHYLNIVLKHWLCRELIGECTRTVTQAFSGQGVDDPNQLLAEHSTRLQKLSTSLTSFNPDYFFSHEQSLQYPFQLEATAAEVADHDPWNTHQSDDGQGQMGARLPGLRFGWDALDGRAWEQEPSLSLLPSTLTTILGRTGGGKTIAAMQIADTNAQAGLNVLYFHVELNQEQMMARRYCRLTGIPVMRQLLKRSAGSELEQLVEAAAEVARWPGRVDFVHCPNWSIGKLVSELKARHYALLASKGRGYDLVVLDYIQRLGRSENGSRWGNEDERQSLVYNVRGFSDAANELNIAALMTSQVGRNDQRPNEPPELDEGLGTGDIERCSNQVLSLAVGEDKTCVKFAIRKNTFGQVGGSGELLYDAKRLRFI